MIISAAIPFFILRFTLMSTGIAAECIRTLHVPGGKRGGKHSRQQYMEFLRQRLVCRRGDAVAHDG